MEPGFTAGRPGISFKCGKLYDFDDRRVLVLSAGNNPRCWVKSKGKPWWHSSRKAMNKLMKNLPVCPEEPTDIMGRCGKRYVQVNGQLVEPFAVHFQRQSDFELYRYQQFISPEILERICRFSDRRWQMYNLLARVPGAMDLCDSNPALAYMLANNWVFHSPSVKNHLRSARSLIGKKQFRILEWLGFDGTKSTRNILRKIQPASVNVRQLFFLRNKLADSEVRKLLAHVSSINCELLRLATDEKFFGHLTPTLAEELGSHIDRPDGEKYLFLRYLKDLVRMADLMEWKGVPKKIKSTRQLVKLHDQLAKESYRDSLPEELPAPPFPGSDTILPIQTLEELEKEAREQENCAASYAEDIQYGHCYIYRVLAPIRATLGISRKNRTGKWMVFDLAGRSNSPIPTETRSVIKKELFRGEAV